MREEKKVGLMYETESIYEFQWLITGFSSFNIATGKCIRSPYFLFDNIKWYILLYPNGVNEENKQNISISLCSNIFTRAECELSAISICIQKFTFNNKIHTCDKFISRNALLNSLIHDVLVISIKFANLNNEKIYYKLLKDIRLLLKTKKYADVVLVSDEGSKHEVHKAILACRSKVFSAMFQRNMKESQDNIVQIKDVDSKTLSLMINFLYTGKIFSVDSNKDLLIKLLIAADRYSINDLKVVCIDELLSIMNFDNILELIQVGDAYNIDKLKQRTKDYFLENRKEILSIERHEKLKNLSRDLVEELLCDLSSDLSS